MQEVVLSGNTTDPRDMVYGLLGLIKKSIVVDYVASTPQSIYLDVVHHSISVEKALDVINKEGTKLITGAAKLGSGLVSCR